MSYVEKTHNIARRLTEGYKFYASGLIFDEKGRILLTRRSFTAPWMPLKWNLPSGTIEQGETPLAGLKRELKEELMLETDSNNFRLIEVFYEKDQKYMLYLFNVVIDVNKIHMLTLDFENDKYAWVKQDDLRNYDLIPDLPRHLGKVLNLEENDLVESDPIQKSFNNLLGIMPSVKKRRGQKDYIDDLLKAVLKGTHKKDNPDYEPIYNGSKIVGYRKKGKYEAKNEKHKGKVEEAKKKLPAVGDTVTFKNKKGEAVTGVITKHGVEHSSLGKVIHIKTDHGVYTRYSHNVTASEPKDGAGEPKEAQKPEPKAKVDKPKDEKKKEKPKEEKSKAAKVEKKEEKPKNITEHAKNTPTGKLKSYVSKNEPNEVKVAKKELAKREEVKKEKKAKKIEEAKEDFVEHTDLIKASLYLKELGYSKNQFFSEEMSVTTHSINRVNKAVHSIYKKFNLMPLDKIGFVKKDNSPNNANATYWSSPVHSYININAKLAEPDYSPHPLNVLKYKQARTELDAYKRVSNPSLMVKKKIADLEEAAKFERFSVSSSFKGPEATIVHELGHKIQHEITGLQNSGERLNRSLMDDNTAQEKFSDWSRFFNVCKRNGDINKISKYATTNYKEFFAESFTMYILEPDKLPVKIKDKLESLLKYVRK